MATKRHSRKKHHGHWGKHSGRRVYRTKTERREVRHASAVVHGARLLNEIKKAKRQHKRRPKRLGRVGVASATIALSRGKHPHGHKRSASAKRGKASSRARSTAPRRAKVVRVTASKTAASPRKSWNSDVINLLRSVEGR